MISGQKIIAMIPARMGSTRLAKKNLALINGKPMVAWAVDAARESGVFDRIVLNADHEVFGKLAARCGVDFYQRPTHLGSSTTKSDHVVEDFMQKHPGDVLVWVNPIAPLQPAEEVGAAVRHFVQERFDSLITVHPEQVHCLLDGEPVNYKKDGIFAQTQDLHPVQRFVYSLMMWRHAPFLRTMKEQGHAFFCGRFATYPVSRLSALIVKTEDDLKLLDWIARGREAHGREPLRYDPLANES